MRTIKFRAWDKRVNRMVHTSSFGGSVHPVQDSSDNSFNIRLGHSDDVILMQFTGLKDKNGIEIYWKDNVNVHYFYFNGSGEAEAEMSGTIGEREYGLTLENVKGSQFEKHTGYEPNEGWIYLATWSGLHEESFEITGNDFENKQ